MLCVAGCYHRDIVAVNSRRQNRGEFALCVSRHLHKHAKMRQKKNAELQRVFCSKFKPQANEIIILHNHKMHKKAVNMPKNGWVDLRLKQWNVSTKDMTGC